MVAIVFFDTAVFCLGVIVVVFVVAVFLVAPEGGVVFLVEADPFLSMALDAVLAVVAGVLVVAVGGLGDFLRDVEAVVVGGVLVPVLLEPAGTMVGVVAEPELRLIWPAAWLLGVF